jgi:two-component system sensor histidine kinase KdpD
MSISDNRPDPDALLEKIEAEELKSKRGELKIFFGCCPGVGKTYAMLAAAQVKRKEGVNIVAGIVETHGRTETENLLAELSQIPLLSINHRGIVLHELNLQAVKERKPDIVLVDELAHTNAPGVWHPKRWNDVQELLDSGIDVYSTLNVQHLESLSDIIAGITGVTVKETVPDSIFDNADDIILVDINSDELLKRLREGKVYLAEQARANAAEHFFKKKNIIALRELALRRTAERVDAQMGDYNLREGIKDAVPIAEKIMVCIGPEPLSSKLVRSAKRLSTALKAPWVAVYVENARHYRLNDQGRMAVSSVMRMVERNGGKSIILQGNDAVEEIINYANANRITKIIIGKPNKGAFKEFLYGSLVDRVVRRSGNIDVYVITGDRAELGKLRQIPSIFRLKLTFYLYGLLAASLCTAITWIFDPLLEPIDQVMFYLIGAVMVAAKFGRGPALLYSLLSVSAFNFFFVETHHSFSILESSYWMTFMVMLSTSLVISEQATKLRLQALFSRKRANENQIFYAMTRDISATRGRVNIADVSIKHIQAALDMDVTAWNVNNTSNVEVISGYPNYFDVKEESAVRWCYENKRIAGFGTETLPTAKGLYIPLLSSNQVFGVLGIIPKDEDHPIDVLQIPYIETFANILGSALERANTAELVEVSKVEAESEKLRNTLLSSVSHDLRTPLASITGASSNIILDSETLPRETIKHLATSINSEASRLSRIITNLLDVTNLECGSVALHKQPYFMEELIGTVLVRLQQTLADHHVSTNVAANLPIVQMDGVLIEQVLTNLLENAVRYTPQGSSIIISVSCKQNELLVSIDDNGPGIPSGDEEKIFGKFYTAGQPVAQKGTGLGLAICSAIISAHGGTIKAENRTEGGARFIFTLPSSHYQKKNSKDDYE